MSRRRLDDVVGVGGVEPVAAEDAAQSGRESLDERLPSLFVAAGGGKDERTEVVGGRGRLLRLAPRGALQVCLALTGEFVVDERVSGHFRLPFLDSIALCDR
jgi:hypothetical protein